MWANAIVEFIEPAILVLTEKLKERVKEQTLHYRV
jgi:hypothetical protein